MRFSRVSLLTIGYELAPVVVSSRQLESRLGPLYERLGLQEGYLASLTGIKERRWWPKQYSLSERAAVAATRALAQAGLEPDELGAVIYGGVCRENHEPATACAVAERLGVTGAVCVQDISNACLGALSGILAIANMIELGQIRAGVVVAAESAREINDAMIEDMLDDPTMDRFRLGMATLTGGSGAVAIVLVDNTYYTQRRAHRLRGATILAEPAHHRLCRWGADTRVPSRRSEVMETDAVSVLKAGVPLGARTWQAFFSQMEWARQDVSKVISHQVGQANREQILRALDIPDTRDFSTYPFLGNTGSVAVPITAAIAAERGFLQTGDNVAFLGIGSGLSCLMLGWEW